jgi:hypothetical protein
MHDENDKAATPGVHAAPVADDGIPILREVVNPNESSLHIPTLEPTDAVTSPIAAPGDEGLSPERLAELTDTLQLTLNRELDYAIDGAVYDRLQTAMEEVAASVKEQVHAQLEQKLPELIEQTLRKEN